MSKMVEDQVSQNSVTRPRILVLTRSATIFFTLVFITLFIVFTLHHDSTTTTTLMQVRNPRRNFLTKKLDKNVSDTSQMSLSDTNSNAENPTRVPQEIINTKMLDLDWVSVELEQNYSSKLLAKWLERGGEPCKDSQTGEIKLVNIDDTKEITFPTGYAHEVVFQALDEQGKPRCQGGDYFEIDVSSESWKSRPPMKDYGNGTYSFTVQIEPHFHGNYTVKIILLFRHYKGLSFSPTRFAVDKELRNLPITFTWTDIKLAELKTCQKSDFRRGLWAGRWTRHARNDSCGISDDGRYMCLDANYQCTSPWCKGSLGSLESNGWVYSAHCSFKLFSRDDVWECLNGRWMFSWGDSNHIDTIRNVMFFVLDVPTPPITRRFDLNITNPRDASQWVRITNIFNGHWDDKSNYLGLNSLSNEGYRKLLQDYFSGSIVPDTVLFNSGLHDGVYWPNIRRFVGGAEYAASFWKEIVDGVKRRGLNPPNFIYRSTITAGGYARTLAFNPSKIEAFNGVLLEKMRNVGIVTRIIDNFDMTWAWHYDNRGNDGVHYGRFPAKRKWRDGQIGHQYFVDLMLGHVLLNAICGK